MGATGWRRRIVLQSPMEFLGPLLWRNVPRVVVDRINRRTKIEAHGRAIDRKNEELKEIWGDYVIGGGMDFNRDLKCVRTIRQEERAIHNRMIGVVGILL